MCCELPVAVGGLPPAEPQSLRVDRTSIITVLGEIRTGFLEDVASGQRVRESPAAGVATVLFLWAQLGCMHRARKGLNQQSQRNCQRPRWPLHLAGVGRVPHAVPTLGLAMLGTWEGLGNGPGRAAWGGGTQDGVPVPHSQPPRHPGTQVPMAALSSRSDKNS